MTAIEINGYDYYRHWTGRLVYTAGVALLAETHGAYWLIDAIASHQPGVKRRSSDNGAFQVWNLTLTGEGGRSGALLVCHEDTCHDKAHLQCKPSARQMIEYTDYPENVKLYLCDGVLLLPEEY